MKPSDPQIHIVMATRNGADFIAAQLGSLQAQNHTNWTLILSDDASQDATRDIARRSLPATQLRLIQGPCQGVARNFLHGLAQVPPGSYAAFCDQDDLWFPDKLSRALRALQRQEGAVLYTAGRCVTDARLRHPTQQMRRASASFGRTLWRNRAAGHTCVLSPQAVSVMQQTLPTTPIPFHDWWAALLVMGVGGIWIHDPVPVLLYRQHAANVIGAAGGRARLLANGTYLRWVAQNCTALEPHRSRMTNAAQRALDRALWITSVCRAR